jgi:acyl-coenzyme A synthetase/AMP-(fatty) acid ligase
MAVANSGIPQHRGGLHDSHLATAAQERVAMIVEDDQRGTSQVTYRELAERTSRFAQLLRAMGVAAGDRVLIRLPNSIDYATAFLGSLKRGASRCRPRRCSPRRRCATCCRLAGRGAGDRRGGAPGDERAAARLRILREVIVAGARWRARSPRCVGRAARAHAPRRPRLPVYTSGTTGYPKGVLHGHRSLVGRMPARSTGSTSRQPPVVDRIVHSGKFNWTYVLGSALMDPLFRGQTVIAHEGRNDAATWPKLIAKHAATIFIGVPTIYRQILQKTTLGRADVPRCAIA